MPAGCQNKWLQPFSKLGRQQGLLDQKGRGTEAEVCIHRIHVLRPDNFILENVADAKTAHDGKFWNTLTTQLSEEGYTLDDCILDAQHYGTPQTRLRVYLIGRRGKHPPITFTKPDVNMNIETILDPPEEDDDPTRVPLGLQVGEKFGKPNKYTEKVQKEINRLRTKNLFNAEERSLDIEEGRSDKKTIDGAKVKKQRFPHS